MRVLHISNDYYNSGVYRTLHEGHLRHGLDSVFFVPMTKDSPVGNNERVMEAHCFRHADRFFYMNKQRKIYRYFREAVRQHKPELNHGYFLFSGGIHCLWAKREFGIPYVITVQDTDVNTIFKYFVHLRGLAWDIIREAERVIFVSDSYMNYALEHMVPSKHRHEQAKKFSLLPFAIDPFWVDHADTSAHPEHDEPVRLLTVGLVIPRKNQLCTAEAVRQLRQQGINAELTVIGAGVDADMDTKLRAMDFVRRIERIPKEQLISEYRRADIFVLPSLTESFGLVYAEALTQGIPVLYSAGQGFDMQFPEGFVGYRMDAQSPEAVAAAIRNVMENYKQMQENCAHAVEKFTPETVCSVCEELYRTALAKKENE